MTVLCVAIHGVGSQKELVIKSQVEETLGKTRFRDSVIVEEFNWDKLVEHSSQRSIRDMVWFLEATAENISVSSRLGLRSGNTGVQRFFGALQFHGHRLCQWIIALSIGLIATGTITPLVMSIPNLMFGLSTSYDSIFRWLPITLNFLFVAVLFLSGFVLAIGLIRAAMALSVRPLNEAVRSTVLLYLQPILVFISGMLATKWTSVTRPVWLFGGFILVVSMIAYVFSLFSGEPFFYGATLKYSAYVLLAAAALVLLQLKLSHVWFGIIVKVLLDIFRYLGDPKYRLSVHQSLDNKLEDLRTSHGDNSQFILLAHSLGSVIAVDSILTSSFWRQGDTVYLITMGSPIRRMFQRFFPKILLPASTVPMAQSAASRVGSLYWVNVFRPFDYIGKALSLGRHGVGVDASTRERSRFFSAHTDYWSDGGGDAVHETIEAALEGLEPIARPAAGSDAPVYAIPSPPARDALVSGLRGAASVAGFVLYIAMFVGSLFWVSSSLEDRNVELAEINIRLQNEGIEVSAAVHYDRDNVGFGQGGTIIDKFTIRYTDPATSEPRTEPFEFDQATGFPAHRQRFDESVLAKYIRSLCPEPWWKFWRINSRGIPCEAQGVRFRYLPDDTKSYDFPDFPSTDETRSSKWSWFTIIWISLIIPVFALFPLAISGALFMLLLGHAPFGRPSPQ